MILFTTALLALLSNPSDVQPAQAQIAAGASAVVEPGVTDAQGKKTADDPDHKKKDDDKGDKKKKAADDQRKQWDAAKDKELPKALEKLKDPNGAGFEFKFDLKTLDGKPLAKDELKGKVVIVDIWGTWCPPCRAEIPNFVEVVKRHEKDAFMMIGLNDEDRKQNADAEGAKKSAEKFAKENGINYTLGLIDSATIKQVPGFSGYPTTLFIDKTGKVRFMEVGYSSVGFIDGIVKELLAEKGPAVKAGDKDKAKPEAPKKSSS